MTTAEYIQMVYPNSWAAELLTFVSEYNEWLDEVERVNSRPEWQYDFYADEWVDDAGYAGDPFAGVEF